MDELVRLRTALRSPLPGHDAFVEVSGYKRPDMDQVLAMDPPPRESAVLIAVYPELGSYHTLLMLRPAYDGVHSGQVSFPGGRREPGDASLEATALREFSEETGSMAPVEVLGTLSPVFIPPSHSLVTPFVGFVPALGDLRPDPREVAELIHTPLQLLLEAELKYGEQYVQVMRARLKVPYFDVQGHVVWGATAMMVAELRALMGSA
jgi:8-oxo-dGTP pyrophosphatase MutT (NUDIX family)